MRCLAILAFLIGLTSEASAARLWADPVIRVDPRDPTVHQPVTIILPAMGTFLSGGPSDFDDFEITSENNTISISAKQYPLITPPEDPWGYWWEYPFALGELPPGHYQINYRLTSLDDTVLFEGSVAFSVSFAKPVPTLNNMMLLALSIGLAFAAAIMRAKLPADCLISHEGKAR